MNKIVAISAIFAISVLAIDVPVGKVTEESWSLFGVSHGSKSYNKEISSIIEKDKISFVYSWNPDTQSFSSYSKVNADRARPQGFYNLEKGKAYWILSTDSLNISIEPEEVTNNYILVENWNFVTAPIGVTDSVQFAINLRNNGITPTFIYGWDTDTQSFSSYSKTNEDRNRPQGLVNLTQNNGYWIYVDSIDYDTFIQNTLTADPDLTSYTTENLNNKSILVMENNSGALKTSLITFDNNQTYKEVEVSGFSASTLSGTDADINATVSSAVSSLTTGSCGNWNFDSTDLYITPVSGTTIGATVQIANSADGNFTIGSIYKKVVYYGEAIDLSSVTDCQLDSFLLPPSVPGS